VFNSPAPPSEFRHEQEDPTIKRLLLRIRGLAFCFMPKPIARSKTRKAVAKRFKVTARGKVLRTRSSTPSVVDEKREAQTPACQNSARR